MTILIGILTVLVVIDCMFLILLVLVQLPKKEAGAGMAFGGGAADALLGAGSGNALTKITAVAATIFFALTLFISVLQGVKNRSRSEGLDRALQAAPADAKAPAPKSPGVNLVTPEGVSNATPAQPPAPSTPPAPAKP